MLRLILANATGPVVIHEATRKDWIQYQEEANIEFPLGDGTRDLEIQDAEDIAVAETYWAWGHDGQNTAIQNIAKALISGIQGGATRLEVVRLG